MYPAPDVRRPRFSVSVKAEVPLTTGGIVRIPARGYRWNVLSLIVQSLTSFADASQITTTYQLFAGDDRPTDLLATINAPGFATLTTDPNRPVLIEPYDELVVKLTFENLPEGNITQATVQVRVQLEELR